MKKTPATAPSALDALLQRARARFTGRATLTVSEMCEFLTASTRHVTDLAEEYEATKGASGLAAVDTTVRPKSAWRFTLSALERFLKERWAA